MLVKILPEWSRGDRTSSPTGTRSGSERERERSRKGSFLFFVEPIRLHYVCLSIAAK